MANTLYDIGRELFLSGAINWGDPAVSLKCVLVDTGAGHYSFNAAHLYYDAITGVAGTVAGPNALVWSGSGTPNRPVAGGAADADDITFSAVSSSLPSIEAIVIFKDTGVASTSPLIAYIDTATGLPITPNGGDIIVTWDNGINKIFRL